MLRLIWHFLCLRLLTPRPWTPPNHAAVTSSVFLVSRPTQKPELSLHLFPHMHTLALWLFPPSSSDASQKEPPPLDQHEFSPPTSRAPKAPEACRSPSSTFRVRKVVDSCGSSVGFAADQTGN